MPSSRNHAVAAPSRLPLLFLWAILAVVMLLPPLLLLGGQDSGKLTHPGTWAGPAIVLVTGVALSLAYLRRRITLDGTQLTVHSTFYRKTVGTGALRLEQARVVDLAEHTDLKPAFKTNGYGLPGFMSGHFRMRGGGKAFCLLTDYSRVLVLPLRDGSMLLLSPEHPRALLDALKQAA